MKKISCISCSNTHCFIKEHCSSNKTISDLKKIQTTFKQGHNIITKGLPVLGIFFIQKGKVKIFSIGLNGRPQIVRFANDGHILGHRGLGNEVYPISAVAMEDSLICFIENNKLYELFMSNPEFTLGLVKFYSRELLKVENRIKNIAQMNTRKKIAEALLLILNDFGLNEQNELNVPFTREDIANTAGTNADQVVRQLSDFAEEGIIAKRGRKIVILNLEGLKKIISAHSPKMIKR